MDLSRDSLQMGALVGAARVQPGGRVCRRPEPRFAVITGEAASAARLGRVPACPRL